MPDAVPQSLAAAPTVSSAPVTYTEFDDVRQVPFKPQQAPTGELAAPRSGTLTASACTPGAPVSSGDVVGSIDAVPVVALNTDYPLYRDLIAGDKGADVVSLQRELARLGYKPTTKGTLDRATVKAIKAFLTDRGFTKPDGSFSLSMTMRMPAGQLTTGGCPVAVGDAVGEGSALVTTGGAITSLQVASAPENLTPGPRVARYQDLAAPVDEAGRVTDAAFLAALLETDIWNGWKLSNGEVPLTLEYALATPLHTAAVPPGALYNVGGGAGCITAPDGAHPVTIVSSSLGSTYVTVDDGAQPSSVSLATASDRSKAGEATCS